MYNNFHHFRIENKLQMLCMSDCLMTATDKRQNEFFVNYLLHMDRNCVRTLECFATFDCWIISFWFRNTRWEDQQLIARQAKLLTVSSLFWRFACAITTHRYSCRRKPESWSPSISLLRTTAWTCLHENVILSFNLFTTPVLIRLTYLGPKYQK